MTLVLSGLLGEDVAFKSLTSFNRSACANREALFSATLALHLGHKAPLHLLVQHRWQPTVTLPVPRSTSNSQDLTTPPYLNNKPHLSTWLAMFITLPYEWEPTPSPSGDLPFLETVQLGHALASPISNAPTF